MLQLDGVVFDVDGVLFDTERLTQRIWLAVSREMGWPQVGEQYLHYVGRNRTDIRQQMLELYGSEFPREEFLQTCSRQAQERMEREGLPVKPGVHEILSFLKRRNIPIALATSTGQERTHRRMELSGLGPFFRAIVTGDRILHSKPEPEIYLLACRELGVEPERAVAVEDSHNGILSAYAAGMKAVMVPDLIPPSPELERLLWRRCNSLLDLLHLFEQELA